jgi:hypothetical protein
MDEPHISQSRGTRVCNRIPFAFEPICLVHQVPSRSSVSLSHGILKSDQVILGPYHAQWCVARWRSGATEGSITNRQAANPATNGCCRRVPGFHVPLLRNVRQPTKSRGSASARHKLISNEEGGSVGCFPGRAAFFVGRNTALASAKVRSRSNSHSRLLSAARSEAD